jgi:hypothetical protein
MIGLLLSLIGAGDHIVHTLDQDVALRGDECVEKLDEIGHGLVHCATENTRVKIASGAGDRHFVVGEPPQTVGKRRCTGIEPVVIRLQEVGEGEQMFRVT